MTKHGRKMMWSLAWIWLVGLLCNVVQAAAPSTWSKSNVRTQPFVMGIMARVSNPQGDIQKTPGSKVAVFYEDELRGVADYDNDDGLYFFNLTVAVASTTESGYSFQYYDAFDDQVFTDWCTALIECQRDRAFFDTLPPLVSKLGEERQVNVEVRGILRSARTEFLLMALMLTGNLPLLYLLNRDWFAALTQSPYGHLVMGLGALVVAVGALLVQHWTRPVRYREKGKGGLL